MCILATIEYAQRILMYQGCNSFDYRKGEEDKSIKYKF